MLIALVQPSLIFLISPPPMKARLIAASFLLIASSAHAQTQITSASDPALVGAILQDFNSVVNGSYGTINLGALTISTIGTDPISFSNGYNGVYGATGTVLLNFTSGFASTVRFSFATPVSAFGFILGGSDSGPGTLSAYDGIGNLLASFNTAFNGPYQSYEGIAAAGISYADWAPYAYPTGNNDTVLIDDFSYQEAVPAPEPASMVLIATGLLGVAAMRRRVSRT